MKKKAFFFDVDGTLLPFGKDYVLNSTRYAFKELQKQGHEIYIATGKSYKDAKWLGDSIGVNNYLSANGQALHKDGVEVATEFFTKEQIESVIKIATENDLTIGFQGTENTVAIPNGFKDKLIEFVEKVSIPCPPFVDEFDYSFGVAQMWLAGDNLDLQFPDDVRSVKWPMIGTDIVLTNASKGNAIKKYFDLDEYETYAFGDGENDIEMFQIVEHSIAMDNAEANVKKHAKYITSSDTEDGIYNFLVKQNLIKPIEETKFAFLDIDGTLLLHGNSEINPEVIEVVSKAKENGVIPFICTGRNVNQAKQYIDALGLDNYITSNGQEVVLNGEVIHLCYFEPSDVNIVKSILDDVGVVFAYENRERIYLTEHAQAKFIHDQIKVQGLLDVEIVEEYNNVGVFQVWSFGTKQQMDEVTAKLKGKFEVIRWDDTVIEIIMQNNNKANGIEKVLQKFDGLAKTYGFGDGANDLEMMDIVDVSVAMGNAIDPLKQKCDLVTKTCSENGIVDAFVNLGLIGK